MSLVKWEPFDEFDRFLRDFNSLALPRNTMVSYDLAVDLYEDESGKHLIAEMNLPGLKGDEIDVEIKDNHLRICGTREEEQEKKDKSHYTKEIRRGSFERIVGLPSPVDANGVTAEYEDGVLTVTMPKLAGDTDNKVKVTVK